MNRDHFSLEQQLALHINNFGVLRLIAAVMVIFSHSFDLVHVTKVSDGIADPLWGRYHYTIGSVAVDMFFIASGMLCARSAEFSKSAFSFVRKRAVRILPGMIGCVLWMLMVTGILFHRNDLMAFCFDEQTIRFLLFNSTLLFGIQVKLVGVFDYASVNGSLWTMPIEVRMYALLALTFVMVSFVRNTKYAWIQWVYKRWLACLASIWFGIASIWFYSVIATDGLSVFMGYSRFLYTFGAGILVYVLRNRIRVHQIYYTLAVASAILFIGLCFSTKLVHLVYPIWIVSVVFGFAFSDYNWLRPLRRIPDYSYGLYLYAWPVQMIAVYLFPSISVMQLFFIALSITSIFASISWHYLEKPLLRFK
jgi:peptidoglycan/LPS O-acetylase OafA/YrhL